MDRTQLIRHIEQAKIHGDLAREAFLRGDLDRAAQEDARVLEAIENAHAIIVEVRAQPRR